jgi:hypothetical protein
VGDSTEGITAQPADSESRLVTLVMCVWEPRVDWMAEAIENALMQTGCAIELLVIDDGSPVPAAELLAEFDDDRMRVIRVEHGGLPWARNAGIRESRGGYVRFIDADDAIEPDSSARLLNLIEGRDDVIAYGATVFCDEHLQPTWKMTSDIDGDAVKACLLGRFTVRPTACLFPRPVLDATGDMNTELALSSDWDFILRALEHATVRGTHAPAAYYRRHGGGQTGSWERGEQAAWQIVESYFQRHPEQRGTALERKARARTLAHIGRVYATRRRPGKAIKTLARAASLDPAAVWFEVAQGLPAATAYGRRRLHMKPPRGLPERPPMARDQAKSSPPFERGRERSAK